jgi:hypothetical protein
MSIVNDKIQNSPAVIVNFGWANSGVITYLSNFVENGVTYPPSGSQYEAFATPINVATTFYATDSASLGLPTVITPTGQTIIQYRWIFGDGTVGFGPTVSHTYSVVVPGISVALQVTVASGKQYSRSQTLNLYSGVIVGVAPYIIVRSS